MADTAADEQIRVGETADGDPLDFPIVEMLTGRGFVTGKSGSGKSNTTSVVVEELLEAGYPVLIVDTDGEYYGLKEEYELLHAGADEECDIQVSVEHAEKLAHLALHENVPIILDVSGFLDEDVANELLRETVRHLFAKEKKLKKPFLLVVEECHEYIPEGGGMDETGNLIIKVGKRGRKHGLGVVGISQRPADVKKDFITQCDWIAWHRLTWDNDTKVVRRIVGSDYADEVDELDDGEAFIQTDWSDDAVRRVQFKRKRTFDAGATPGLDDFERPDLKSVSGSLMDELGDITERKEQERDRIAELESKVENREERIAELESELETARDVSAAARKMANALAHGDGSPPDSYQAKLQTKNQQIENLEERIAELEDRVEQGATGHPESPDAGTEAASDGGAEPADGVDAEADDSHDDLDPGQAAAAASGEDDPSDAETVSKRIQAAVEADAEADEPTEETDDSAAEGRSEASTGETTDETAPSSAPDDGAVVIGDDGERDALVDAVQDRLKRRGERLQLQEGAEDDVYPAPETAVDLLQAPPVVSRLNAARRESRCNEDATWDVISHLATNPGSNAHDVADAVDVDVEAVHTLFSELRARDLVERDDERRYAFNADQMRTLIEQDDPSKPRTELRDQWKP
jgi:chaperonin cofactor prefoldin